MFKNYLKISWKVLLRRKFFTFISLFGIALTLTVLLVATAMLDHIFGPLAPETKLDRTLLIAHMRLHGEDLTFGGSPGFQFLDRYVRDLPGPELVSLFTTEQTGAVYQGDEKIELELKRTDGEYWKILEFEFLEGRPLTSQDEADAAFVAVINRETRARLFGGQDAVGRELEIDAQSFRIVGVVENVSKLRPVPHSDVWVPISTAKSSAYRQNFLGGFKALLLGPDKAALPSIKAELRSRLADVELPQGYDTIHVFAETFFESLARDLFRGHDTDSRFAWRLKLILAGMAVLFMLLPTVNLINVNVSRILERASEIGVRKAFGASSKTLVGQFVVENVILTIIGGLIGFALALVVLQLLSDSGVIPYARFQISYRVLFWGGVLTLFFGVFSGVLPAWKMSRLHPVHALNGTPQS